MTKVKIFGHLNSRYPLKQNLLYISFEFMNEKRQLKKIPNNHVVIVWTRRKIIRKLQNLRNL